MFGWFRKLLGTGQVKFIVTFEDGAQHYATCPYEGDANDIYRPKELAKIKHNIEFKYNRKVKTVTVADILPD